MRFSEHEALVGELRNACKVLVGKSEEDEGLDKNRIRREDNIKLYASWSSSQSL